MGLNDYREYFNKVVRKYLRTNKTEFMWYKMCHECMPESLNDIIVWVDGRCNGKLVRDKVQRELDEIVE